MEMKRIIAVMMILALILTAFAGCGGTTAPTTDGASGDTAKKEKLIMATNAEFPPYEFKEDGKIIGIDAEIAGKIAEKLGMELEIMDIEFNSIIAALDTGKADFAAAGMTVTEEREKSVNFTDSYAKGVQVIIVKEGSAIANPDDLNGKKIGVQQATTGDIYCSGDYGTENVIKYDKGATAVQALVTDKVDAVVIDNEPAKAYVKANEGLKILDTEFITEDYAMAVDKENTELFEKINGALKELIADGTTQQIIDKYIVAD